jgi:hypothetical protein
MNITPRQATEMAEAAKPLMKWLTENCPSFCTVTVEQTRVILREDVFFLITNEATELGDLPEAGVEGTPITLKHDA